MFPLSTRPSASEFFAHRHGVGCHQTSVKNRFYNLCADTEKGIAARMLQHAILLVLSKLSTHSDHNACAKVQKFFSSDVHISKKKVKTSKIVTKIARNCYFKRNNPKLKGCFP